MRPLSAHCHLGLSRASRIAKDREAAEQQLVTAVGFFRDMEMGFWLAKAAAEKDGLC